MLKGGKIKSLLHGGSSKLCTQLWSLMDPMIKVKTDECKIMGQKKMTPLLCGELQI